MINGRRFAMDNCYVNGVIEALKEARGSLLFASGQKGDTHRNTRYGRVKIFLSNKDNYDAFIRSYVLKLIELPFYEGYTDKEKDAVTHNLEKSVRHSLTPLHRQNYNRVEFYIHRDHIAQEKTVYTVWHDTENEEGFVHFVSVTRWHQYEEGYEEYNEGRIAMEFIRKETLHIFRKQAMEMFPDLFLQPCFDMTEEEALFE